LVLSDSAQFSVAIFSFRSLTLSLKFLRIKKVNSMLVKPLFFFSLVAASLAVSIAPLSAAEQSCTMVNSQKFDGLLRTVDFKDVTKIPLQSARSITLNEDKLTIAGRTLEPDMDGKWQRKIRVECHKNGNDWSPCGEPTARIRLQKTGENKLAGIFILNWEYWSLYPPQFKIEYVCSKAKPKRTTATSNTDTKTNISRRIFNSYSLEKRRDIQSVLKRDGFYKSSIDGLYGRGTQNAISRFASENGYSITNSRDVTTTLTNILDKNTKAAPQQVVIATSVNVTKTETTVESKSPATKPAITPSTVAGQKWENAQTVGEAQRFVDEIQATIVMYMAIREVVEEQPLTLKERILSVVDNEISKLQKQKLLSQDRLTQRFTTPIKPSNANLQVSAFRASDTFPKVPFYIPGTNEIGETLVTPNVSDEGYLSYKFDFIDPVATHDKVRDTVFIPHDNINDFITGMGKIDEWTKVAQENSVNRRISKAAACIPIGACDVKKVGISSTELIFQIYEDGSTSGRMQINKGQFNAGYNMSVESTILLQAYLIYMRDLGSKEFNVGVMSDEAVLELFD
ncbi:peptidoglycan-binding protein, partial [bacterium]|nr:peptidoglycan-binding protein [bacterium]